MQNAGENKKALNNEIKKLRIKNRLCYNFNGIIKLDDFDLDNVR